ncbi:Rab family GTPase [Komagataella phaffii CBS 7435]|uniref:Ras-related protein SEC4 n=3 Tax=Komagataella TaxID=460517 RepID=C4R3N7_KOMPG|nr:Secretory vesicle-associated Rab GTPase essential for exocytosis [Komagataella phaffii GS115]AOA64248.1 GQ67_03160T0 [Komagataella phaffii]KAI0461746.1 GTP-binding protein [Komagataella kurtzmanii]CAC24717.1 Sec4p [Komagataella pastoris]CAH2450159.1 Rab family GTPase [Komagataella phaffii CBS 7435]AOA69186.1 GQ68_03145T0 [Komagataella phaffii GS115]
MASRGTSRQQYDLTMKLLLVGDSGVGKSCLLLRFVDDSFNPSFITTIGIDFKIRTVEINGKKVKLQIWDTAGQERFRTITTAYYRGAMGIILVYDVTDERSFNSVHNWYQTLNQHANEDAQLFLVGNKCDDEESRQVTKEQGEQLASELGVPFLEASAKSNKNVDAIFLELAKRFEEKMRNTQQGPGSAGIDVNSSNDTKSSCC